MTSFVFAAVKAQQSKLETLELKLADLEAKVAGVSSSSEVSSSSGGYSPSSVEGSMIASILDYFKTIALQAKEFIADKITAKKVTTDALELKDSATGQIYCVRISNGEWEKTAGSCSDLTPIIPPEPVEGPVPEPTTLSPEPVEGLAPEPSPAPAPEPVPEPPPEPEPAPAAEPEPPAELTPAQ